MHQKEAFKNEFDRILKRINFDLMKIQIANQAIESFNEAKFQFK